MTEAQHMRNLAKLLRQLDEGTVILDSWFAQEAAALLEKYAKEEDEESDA
jgi:hypothetical protein